MGCNYNFYPKLESFNLLSNQIISDCLKCFQEMKYIYRQNDHGLILMAPRVCIDLALSCYNLRQ